MRQLLCPPCGRTTPTPVADITAGIIPRRNEGTLIQSVRCDLCNTELLVGTRAIALSFPRDMKFWEVDYFNWLNDLPGQLI